MRVLTTIASRSPSAELEVLVWRAALAVPEAPLSGPAVVHPEEQSRSASTARGYYGTSELTFDSVVAPVCSVMLVRVGTLAASSF